MARRRDPAIPTGHGNGDVHSVFALGAIALLTAVITTPAQALGRPLPARAVGGHPGQHGRHSPGHAAP